MSGVIVVLSGGAVDIMNPFEVRERMDDYIARVTTATDTTARVVPNQRTRHLHHSRWRQICEALQLRDATPLIVVGHSYGGASALNLARCLDYQGKHIDLLVTADSVAPDHDGEPNLVPGNVRLNLNTYVRRTWRWVLAPFPTGQRNTVASPVSLGRAPRIVNVGLQYNLPGIFAHRNAFYDLAGGDRVGGVDTYPNTLLAMTLAVLRGDPTDAVIADTSVALRVLAARGGFDITQEAT